MIENIKRFVNEHRTLIVVIIIVLVIYFLYWFFCCKDRQLVNKVKGGRCAVVQLSDNIFGIGLKLPIPIPMLSLDCVHLLMNKDKWKNEEKVIIGNIDYLPSSFISKNKVPDILDDPLYYLITKIKTVKLNRELENKGFVGLSLFDNLQKELDKINDTFDFKSILESAFPNDNNFVKEILKLINDFSNELKRDDNIKLAKFIGQLGRYYVKGEINLHKTKEVQTFIERNNNLSPQPLIRESMLLNKYERIFDLHYLGDIHRIKFKQDDLLETVKNCKDVLGKIGVDINKFNEDGTEKDTDVSEDSAEKDTDVSEDSAGDEDIHKSILSEIDQSDIDELKSYYKNHKIDVIKELKKFDKEIAKNKTFDLISKKINERFDEQKFGKTDDDYVKSILDDNTYITGEIKKFNKFRKEFQTLKKFDKKIKKKRFQHIPPDIFTQHYARPGPHLYETSSEVDSDLIDNSIYKKKLTDVLKNMPGYLTEFEAVKNEIKTFVEKGLKYLNDYNNKLSEDILDMNVDNSSLFLTDYHNLMAETNNSIIEELPIDSLMKMKTEFDTKLKELNDHFFSVGENFITGEEKMKEFKTQKESIAREIDELKNDIEKVINFVSEINEIMDYFSHRQLGGNIELVKDVSTTQKTEMIIHILIHGFTDKCRRWFSKGSKPSPYKDMFYNYYLINNSIKIEKGTVIEWQKGGIADIYPAEKLCLFLIYVSLYEGVEIKDVGGKNDAYRIDKLDLKIAAYVLYVFLFNTWCACIMQGQWNSSVSNEYVYEYECEIINGQTQMTFSEENVIKRSAIPYYEKPEFAQSQFSILDEQGQQNFFEAGLSRIPQPQNTIMITKDKKCIVPLGRYISFKRGKGRNQHELYAGNILVLTSGDPITLNINEEITLAVGQKVEIRGLVVSLDLNKKVITLEKGATLKLCEVAPISENENSQNDDDDDF